VARLSGGHVSAKGRGDDEGAQPTPFSGPCATEPAKSGQGEPLNGHDRQACLAFTGLVPSRVLGLPVGENVTLGQALRGDAGITASLQRYQNSSNKSQAASEACVLVADRAEALGLNAYDAAAAVWAFASSGGFNADVSSHVWNDSECTAARLAKRIHLTLKTSSADQPHSPADGEDGTPNHAANGGTTNGAGTEETDASASDTDEE